MEMDERTSDQAPGVAMLGRVHVQRAQAGRYYRHVGTSYTEILAQMPMSKMLLFGLDRHRCPTYFVVTHAQLLACVNIHRWDVFTCSARELYVITAM